MHLLVSLLCSLLLSLVAARPSAERHVHEELILEKRIERTRTIWQEFIVTKTIYEPWPSHHGHLGVENHREAAHFVPGTGTVAPSLTAISSTSLAGSDEEKHQTSTNPLALPLQTGQSVQGSDLSQPTSSVAPWASLQYLDSENKATVALPNHTAQSAEKGSFSQPSSSETSSASSVKALDSQTKQAEESQSSNPTSSLSSAAQSAPSSETSSVTTKDGKYPFSGMVAFGDNLSDNGNGSYAHHVTDHNDPENKVYGAGTWTNAQVAVSYLTDHLGVPMHQNFAFGHAWGGADFGATIDNTIAVSDFHSETAAAAIGYGCPGAPPASMQIENYIKGGVHKNALHFLWIGNSDINLANMQVGWDSLNSGFAANVSEKIPKLIERLLDEGAPYVFVANLYPKHLAPVSWKYFGYNSIEKQDAFGISINKANTALEKAISGNPKFGGKVIYYDVFSYMSSIWNDASDHGITNQKDTNGWPAFCDGDPDKTRDTNNALAAGKIPVKSNPTGANNWGTCVDLGGQETFYWMQYLDMTSKVHKLVASNMASRISDHFSQ